MSESQTNGPRLRNYRHGVHSSGIAIPTGDYSRAWALMTTAEMEIFISQFGADAVPNIQYRTARISAATEGGESFVRQEARRKESHYWCNAESVARNALRIEAWKAQQRRNAKKRVA